MMSRTTLHSVVLVLFTLVYLSATVFAQSQPSEICLFPGAIGTPLGDSCPLGWYCPNYITDDSSTFPVMCTPTIECQRDRVIGKYCDAQGKYEPTVCKPGYYCPPGGLEQLICPSGHFCVSGQYEPTPCGPMISCPEGTSKKMDYSSVISILIADAILLAIYFGSRYWKRYHLSHRDSHYAEVQIGSVNQSLIQKGTLYSDLPIHTKLLCQGFKRAQVGNQLPPMLLEFDKLSLSIPQPNGKPDKVILKGVTGTIEPGKVTAIMGPSGAGKTTFLNTMLGKVDSQWTRGGSLLVNGMSEDLGRFRKIIGYVPQEDILHRDLSSYDNIRYSANIRLPESWTSQQREDHAAAVILAMQLSHVQDTLVGDEVKRGISGGQRKRCNIGVEVAAAPSLLLLDEPTSGLDSTAAMEICQVLKDLARVSGITVALVVHQPRVEIWNQLDELLLLAPGGLTVYQGPQRLCVAYFTQRLDVQIGVNENPADALMDRIAEQGEEFVTSWLAGGPQFVEYLRSTSGLAPVDECMIVSDSDNERSDAVRISIGSSSTVENIYPTIMKQQSPNESPKETEMMLMPSTATAVVSPSPDGIIRVSPRKDSAPLLKPVHSLVRQPSSGVPPPFPPSPLRLTAGFFRQFYLAMMRNFWKQLANLPSLSLEVGLGLLAGISMGAAITIRYSGFLKDDFALLSPSPNDRAIPGLFFNIGLAISLAAASAGVAVFGEEQVIYRREVSAGHRHFAYYLGTSVAQLPRCFIDALHFTFIFHLLCQPIITYGELLPIVFFLFVAIYGLASFVSMLVSRKNAALLGVVLSLLFSSMTGKGGQPEAIQFLSASRWAAEALFDIETKRYRHIMQVEEISAPNLGYHLDRYATDIILMAVICIFYRLCAYIAMRWVDRKIIA